MLPLIFGIIILVIVVFVALRMLENVVVGAVLIGLVFFASFLIFGSWPNLKSLPIVGQYIPELPSTTGEVITIIKNVFYSIDIISVTKDNSGNLLVAVANTGKMSVSDLKVLVNGQKVGITNSPKDPLNSGESTIIETDWNSDFTTVAVQTNEASSTFKQ